jgi:ribosomal peptide maturation radical SAM protein 1
MPYCQLERPSLALPLLKAYLTRADITSTVLYASIDFATEFGLDVYQAIVSTPAETLVGEWTFAAAAFGDAAPDPDKFLAAIGPVLPDQAWFSILKRLHPASDPRRVLTAVREHACEFVDDVARRILATTPRIVGCTSTFQQHCASLALLRRIKELSPDTVTMIGGANCEGVMGETTHRAFPWIDVVMEGEVDAFFGDFCRVILDRGLSAAADQAPEGVFCGDHRRQTTPRLAPPRPALHSMDQAAIPDWDHFVDQLRRAPFGDRVQPALSFETSRGCWWGMKHHCTFCGLNDGNMAYRSKSPRRVVDEVMELGRKYEPSWLEATDAILDPRILNQAMPELAACDHPYIFYEVKANLKREHLELLSRAGVRRIQPGIEGMHDEMLSLMDKGNHWFTNVQVLRWGRQLGISVAWNFLVCVPGEHDEWHSDVAEWLPAIYHLQPAVGVSPILYERFSVYHDRPQNYGLSLVPNRYYRMVYPVPAETLAGLAYFFEDAGTAAPRPRAAHNAVLSRLGEWQRAWADGNGVQLTARDVDGRLLVHDTRGLGNEERLVFTGLERAILLACDSARTRRAVEETVHAQGYEEDSARIGHCIERLQRQRLLLDWQGQILSLHVSEPVMPLIPLDARPGLVNAASFLNRMRERSLAARCSEASESVSPVTQPVAASQGSS